MKLLSTIILFVLFLHANFGQKTTVSADVFTAFSEKKQIDCILELRKQWKAPAHIKNWKKHQKSTYVFNALQTFSSIHQKNIKEFLRAENIPFQPFYVFNGIKVSITEHQLQRLMNHKDIRHIALNKSVPMSTYTTSVDRIPVEWGISKIKADSAWALGYEGAGVVVAGQDTGYDFENPLILGKYRGFSMDSMVNHNYNWHDAIHEINPQNGDPDPANNPCGLNSIIPCDDHGHGTHTMGTMVGQDPNNGIGVAPKATWIACRNMERGWGTPATYSECFEWFLAPTDINNENPDPTKAPHVINNSWGCPPIEGCNIDNWGFMDIIVNNLVAAGVVVVTSAGNSGSQGCGSISNPPSVFQNAFVVGASNVEDIIAPFSSRGPITVDSSYRIKPDVVAPGVNVRSITLEGFGNWSGTSMAGPHVAGAVAIIISANPELAGQVDEISKILRASAVPFQDSMICEGNMALEIPNFVYGHGRIDLIAAIEMSKLYVSSPEISKHNFRIFPNPATDRIFIESPNDAPLTFRLYNVSGQPVLVQRFDNSATEVELPQSLRGMYFYTIIQEHQKFTGKLFID